MTSARRTREGGAPVRAPSTRSPAPSLHDLRELSGPFGLFEHALGREPRPGTGYCTDDNGSALALACQLPDDPFAEELAALSLGFLERAHTGSCHFRLRLGQGGSWTPDPPSDDATGRALLPAASLAAGEALGREDLVAAGLTWLAWLVERESLDGHFSWVQLPWSDSSHDVLPGQAVLLALCSF